MRACRLRLIGIDEVVMFQSEDPFFGCSVGRSDIPDSIATSSLPV